MDALSPDDSRALADALTAGDVTVFVDGTSLRLPEPARRGVEALLAALAAGESVRVGPAPASGPQAGTTPGAVVGPREPLLELVPSQEKLVFEARIAVSDIEHVHAGGTA